MKILCLILICTSSLAASQDAKQPTTLLTALPYKSILLRWAKYDITYGFNGVPDNFRAPIRARFAAVQAATALRFTEADNPDITVNWSAGPGNFVARGGPTEFNERLEITKAALNFNIYDFEWYSGDERGTYGGVYPVGQMRQMDVEGSALHEIGHCLGLNHAVGIEGLSCMYTNLWEGAHILWPYDIECLNYLYPAPSPSVHLSDLDAMKSVLPIKYKLRTIKVKGLPVTVLQAKGLSLWYDAEGNFIK